MNASAEPVAPADVRTRRLAYAAIATAAVLWGASFLLGKLALAEVPPSYLILYRFVLASAVMLPFVRWSRLAWSRPTVWLVLACALVAGPLMFLVQFEGLSRTTASSAALLVAAAPPMLALAAAFFDGERPTRLAWTAIGLATVGAVLLVGRPGPGRTLLGDALVFVSMIAAVGWTLLARRLSRRIGALAATALQFAAGAVILVPIAWALEGPPPLALTGGTWASVLALGLACTAVTFGLWNWGLLHVEAARGGVLGNLEPLIGAVLGVVFLGDVLGPFSLAGGALLLAAAVLVTRPVHPKALKPGGTVL